jgi:hypothetical protein
MTIATCGDDTVDLARDPRNCGRCDNSCSVGQYCAEGECGCRPEYSLIDGQCVDMDVDEDHCGLLDLSCPDNCEGGECVSTCTEGGGSQCGGCEKTTSDELHCGGCKNQDKCSSAGQLCMSGSCHGFVVGVGCTSCPCADCDDNVTYKECCVYPNAPADHIICIESGPCPE